MSTFQKEAKITTASDLLVFFVFSETSCWRGADAATRPRRKPDSHDAGHLGSEFVLLQCQTDDGECPHPACTLRTLEPANEPTIGGGEKESGDSHVSQDHQFNLFLTNKHSVSGAAHY